MNATNTKLHGEGSYNHIYIGLHLITAEVFFVCCRINPYKAEKAWVCTVVTDALVLKYQAINIHSADQLCSVFDQFCPQKITFSEHQKIKQILKKKKKKNRPSCLGVKRRQGAELQYRIFLKISF